MSIKLIVIDDEKGIRQTISDYFEDCGWSVRTFSSGEDALKFLTNESTKYLIVDGRLPGMSGTDFIRKSNSIRTGMKYLFYTGSVDFLIEDDLRESGITEKNIVMKPAMGFTVLRDALEQINESKSKEN